MTPNNPTTPIPPEIGRKVWYFVNNPGGLNGLVQLDPAKPFDVNIVYVHSDTLVNIAGFDHNGTPFARISVPINAVGPGATAWCEWMPYQLGQAAKTQEALKAGVGMHHDGGKPATSPPSHRSGQ